MKTIDLSDLKAGDKAWSCAEGECVIQEHAIGDTWAIRFKDLWFQTNGIQNFSNQYPTLFHSEQEFREYWGLESNQLTKREQFAMAAIQGFKLQLGTEDFIYVEMAKQCVKFADALLTKLNEKP
jgi:hypothetical protein